MVLQIQESSPCLFVVGLDNRFEDFLVTVIIQRDDGCEYGERSVLSIHSEEITLKLEMATVVTVQEYMVCSQSS